MADIRGTYNSNQSYYPRFAYTVGYSETGRNGSSVSYRFTVSYTKSSGWHGYDVQVNWNIGGARGSKQLKSTADTSSGSITFDVSCSTDASGGTVAAQIWSSSNTDSTHWQNSFDTGSRTANKSTFNTAPSISGSVTANGTTGNATIPENQGNIGISWPAASDANGNLSGYRVRVSINGGGYSELGRTNASTRSYNHNVSGYGEGTSFKYVIDAYDSYSTWSGNIYSGVITKNVFTGGYFTGSMPSIGFDTGEITFTFGGGSNTDGTAPRYHVYSDTVTVYNGREVTSGSETIKIWRSGGFPSTPYIRFDDLKRWCDQQGNSYNGNIHIGLRTGNGRDNWRWNGNSVWVDLRTSPNPATSTTIQVNGNSTNYTANYFIPKPNKYTRITWNAGSDKLGGAINYEVYVRYNGGSWQHIGNTSGTSMNHYASETGSKITAQYLVRAVATFGYYYADSYTQTVDYHYYNAPSFSAGEIKRTATSAECNFIVRANTSISGVGVNGSWYCRQKGASSNVSNGSIANSQNSQKITATGLADNLQYDVVFSINDTLGISAAQPGNMSIGVNSPIVFINKYGLGVGGAKARSDAALIVTGRSALGIVGQFAGSVGTGMNFNNILTEGEYSVGGDNIGNAPFTGGIYGKLIVKVNDGGTHNNANNWIWQIFYRTENNQVFRRCKTNAGGWTGWAQEWSTANLNPDVLYTKDSVTTGWFRCPDNNGIYWQKWGGGWHMEDSTWIRAYNGKSIYTPSVIRCDGGFQLSGNATLSWDSVFIKSNGSSYLDLYAPDMSSHFGNNFTVYHGSPGNGQARFKVTGDTVYSYRDLKVDRIKGNTSNTRLYLGDGGNCRIDATSDCYCRLYVATWAAGAADTGSYWSPYGGMAIKVSGVDKHDLRANGTKIGGSIEIEGMTYGMSPTDSPRSLIEDIIFDKEINGEIRIEINDILSKSLDKYAVFPSDGDVKVITKAKTYFIVKSDKPCTCDFRIVGTRIDVKNQYYEIMGGIRNGSEAEVSY